MENRGVPRPALAILCIPADYGVEGAVLTGSELPASVRSGRALHWRTFYLHVFPAEQ